MPPHTRLVRRAPLSQRLKAHLNPFDFLLWLSEELNTNELDHTLRQWAVPLGLVINLVFMVSRANAKGVDPELDVFADAHERQGSGWLAWVASFTVFLLTILSFTNAFYTFFRTRHYRLFENNINIVPSTPSAHRVRVDSSPISSSPLRYLSDLLTSSNAESRAHPDAARDVWELRVWDPTSICLKLFCFFSPGHVFVYWLFLPLDTLDPRPSVTVAKTIALNVLLTVQLTLLQAFFSQQAKDSTLIQKEVQNEYDTKYVHPMTHVPVRDVGTQMTSTGTPRGTHEVLVSTPRTNVNRGFNPRPNPTYASHYDPDATRSAAFKPREPTRSVTTPQFRNSMVSTSDYSSPIKQTPGLGRRPSFIPNQTGGAVGGGYLGVTSHAQSPLRKQAPDLHQRRSYGGGELQQREPARRQGSPLKRSSMPGVGGHLKGEGARRTTDRDRRAI
ncbi:MAG: hypothetical protein Q9159_007367 [Coniocarpon cinnabarinum]